MSNEDKNMALWDKVCTTDPDHTVKTKINGQQRTTTKAAFQKKKATEIFGIYGLDWGVRTGSEQYEKIDFGDNSIMMYTAVMYFTFDGRVGEFPIAASIKLAYTAKAGTENAYIRIDDEAIKKVRTDALTKGLSELGFSADVFQGQFDNRNYAPIAAEKVAEENEKRAVKEAEEYAKWKVEALSEYAKLTTISAVNTTHTMHCRKANTMGDKGAMKAFTTAKDKRVEEIKKLAEQAKKEQGDDE